MFYLVYRTTNHVNGKFYIGCHKTSKLNDGYLGSGKRLKRAIKKYGRENFSTSIVQIFTNEEDMFAFERALVTVCKNDPYCYNIADGGRGGWGHIEWTDEMRAEKAAILHRINSCPELSAKRKANAAARNNSEEARRKRSESLKGRRTWLGKKHSEASKNKIGQANAKHQLGENNSQFGTCWVSNDALQQTKKIKLSELDQALTDGWVRGRKVYGIPSG